MITNHIELTVNLAAIAAGGPIMALSRMISPRAPGACPTISPPNPRRMHAPCANVGSTPPGVLWWSSFGTSVRRTRPGPTRWRGGAVGTAAASPNSARSPPVSGAVRARSGSGAVIHSRRCRRGRSPSRSDGGRRVGIRMGTAFRIVRINCVRQWGPIMARPPGSLIVGRVGQRRVRRLR